MWFFSRVGSKMFLKMMFFRKTCTACVTFVFLTPSVDQLMFLQMRLRCKAPFTRVTFVVSVSSVNDRVMRSQLSFKGETVTANVTFVRFGLGFVYVTMLVWKIVIAFSTLYSNLYHFWYTQLF